MRTESLLWGTKHSTNQSKRYSTLQQQSQTPSQRLESYMDTYYSILTMSAASWDVICTELSDRNLLYIIISNLLYGLRFSDPPFGH